MVPSGVLLIGQRRREAESAVRRHSRDKNRSVRAGLSNVGTKQFHQSVIKRSLYFWSTRFNRFVRRFSPSNLVALQQAYIQHKAAATFISNYEALDIAAIKLSPNSANVWSISPPDRDLMVMEVNSSECLMEWII
jgi:hypothetical protein